MENEQKNGKEHEEEELVENLDTKEPKNILKKKGPRIYPRI